ncbi:ABC transporter ATP-binding protein [Marinicella rhabdoformis]|uniref:ABC transporter ATP-binding protein n=1 Tax=Marinicella rhabdoformis TaxID=2580566 RepID=UPI0012AED9DC|nr:ABC transporter ATP-binding protein [Marinicella rhabdoformis]
MIKIQSLTKTYGQFTAADAVSFDVQAGEVFGLLGPNGAGKSTTINCLSGLLEATSGDISIDGHPMVGDGINAKKSLGLVPQELALYEDLTALENLNFWGQAYGLSGKTLNQRIQSVLQQVGLSDRQKDLVNTYSGGMKRRLNFACAILHEPKALLLDEPTVGVDPQSREHLLTAVGELKQKGTAVIYTSHYMEEVERLCDRIAIIDKGHVIAQGTIGELRQQMGEKDLISLRGDFSGASQDLLSDFEVLEWTDEAVRFLCPNAAEQLSDLLSRFKDCRIKETSVQQANLESLFIKLTGRALRD